MTLTSSHSSIIVVGLRIAGVLCQAATFVLLVNALPARDVGIFSVLYVFWSLVRMLGPAGFDHIILRDVAGARARGEEGYARTLCWYGSLSISGLGLVLAAATVVVLVAVNAITGEYLSAVEIGLVAGAVPAFAVMGVLASALRGFDRNVTSQGIESFGLHLLALGLVAGWSWFGTLDLAAVLACMAGSAWAATVVYALVLAARAAGPFGAITAEARRSLRRQSLEVWQALLLIGLADRAPNYISMILLGPVPTAILEVAMRFGTLPTIFTTGVSVTFSPVFAGHHVRNEREAFSEALAVGSWLAFVPSAGVLLVILFFGPWLLDLFFPEIYQDAYIPLLVIVASCAINAAYGLSSPILLMTGRQRLVRTYSLFRTRRGRRVGDRAGLLARRRRDRAVVPDRLRRLRHWARQAGQAAARRVGLPATAGAAGTVPHAEDRGMTPGATTLDRAQPLTVAAVFANGLVAAALIYTLVFDMLGEGLRVAVAGALGLALVARCVASWRHPSAQTATLLFAAIFLVCAFYFVFMMEPHAHSLGEYSGLALRLMTCISVLIYFNFEEKVISPRLLAFLCISILIAAAWTVLTEPSIVYAELLRPATFTGGFEGVHSSGYVTAAAFVGVVVLWKLSWIRTGMLVVLGAPLLMIVVAYQVRTTWLMIAVFVVTMLTLHWRSRSRDGAWLFLPIVGILALLVGVAYSSQVDLLTLSSGRTSAYEERIELIFHRPPLELLFGTGPGSELLPSEVWWWAPKNSHNDFIDLTIQLGLVGLTLFVALLAVILRTLDETRIALFAMFVASSLFSNGLLARPYVAVLFLAFALLPARVPSHARGAPAGAYAVG